MGGALDHATGPIVVFDDDHFYMGSSMAEVAAATGQKVTFVTPNARVAGWSEHSLEQDRIQTRLIELGVDIVPSHSLGGYRDGQLDVDCVYSGRTKSLDCTHLVSVTARLPVEDLWLDLQARSEGWTDAGTESVSRIGDCVSPGLIAAAVYSGHDYARKVLDGENAVVRREDHLQGLYEL